MYYHSRIRGLFKAVCYDVGQNCHCMSCRLLAPQPGIPSSVSLLLAMPTVFLISRKHAESQAAGTQTLSYKHQGPQLAC